MPPVLKKRLGGLCLLAAMVISLVGAPIMALGQGAGPRLALVIGNSSYASLPLATGANDAGLIAQTLQQSGFEVTAASDLSLDQLRAAFRDFIAKAQAAGPDAVLFVYLAGRGLQYAGDNFFEPVDAVIGRDTDVPLAALRLSDYLQALNSVPAQGRIVVLDAARPNGLTTGEQSQLASGLALVDAPAGSLYAMNATPGTIASDEPGPYGAYARAVVEMMQEGLPADQVFARARVRVTELTRGAVVPWDESQLAAPVTFFAPSNEAPPPTNFVKPLSDYPAAEAYYIAVERDTLRAYQDFLAAFPRDPMAPRVRALIAARREALTWRRAYAANTADAYWSYMQRYPHGPHFWDARRRLAEINAALAPPPEFSPYGFEGLPPPEEDEYAIVDQPVIIFEGPDYTPSPPPPVGFLPAQPDRFRHMPPPAPAARGAVPLPASQPAGRPLTTHPGAITPPRLPPARPAGAPAPHPAGAPVPPPVAPHPAPAPPAAVPPHPAAPPPPHPAAPPPPHPAAPPPPHPAPPPPPPPHPAAPPPPRPAPPPPHPAAPPPPPHPAPPPPHPTDKKDEKK